MNARLRDFLIRNKIFFETLAAVALSTMALIVAIVQIWLASEQNKLLQGQNELVQLQTAAERQQVLPQIEVNSRLSFQEIDGVRSATDEVVVVINHGALVRNVDAETAIYIRATLSPSDPSSNENREIWLPVNSYYVITTYSGSGMGWLAELSEPNNNLRFTDLLQEYSELAQEAGYFGDLKRRQYLKLTYQDIFGDTQTEYHQILPLGNSRILTEAEAEPKFEQHRLGWEGKTFDFSSLTAEQLLAIVMQSAATADSE